MKTTFLLKISSALLAFALSASPVRADYQAEINTLQDDLRKSLAAQTELQNTVKLLNTELEKNATQKESFKEVMQSLHQRIDSLAGQIHNDEKLIADLQAQQNKLRLEQALQIASQIYEDAAVGGNEGDASFAFPAYDTIVHHAREQNYRPQRIGLWLEEYWFRDFVLDPPTNWGDDTMHIPARDGYEDVESRYVVIDIPSGYHLARIDFEYWSWIDLMGFTFEAPGRPAIHQSFGRRNSGERKGSVGRSGFEILGTFGLRGKYIVNVGARLRTLDWPSQ